jgi:predicted secreted protein
MASGERISVQRQADEARRKLQREWFNRGIRAAAQEAEQSNADNGYVVANDILALLKNPKGRK